MSESVAAVAADSAKKKKSKKEDGAEGDEVKAKSKSKKKAEGEKSTEERKSRKGARPAAVNNWNGAAAEEKEVEEQCSCKNFPVGEEVEVCVKTKMREEEDMESRDVLPLSEGTRCRVLEHGSEASSRRLKVVELESGQGGWISCVNRSGKAFIKSLGPSDAPKAADSPVAAPAEAAAPARAAEAPTAEPPAPSSPLGSAAQGPTRMELIERLFMLLDTERKEALDLHGLRAYAALCGFNDTEDQWAREYDALCRRYGWNGPKGVDVQNFAQLIDDEDGAAYCTDEELVSVLEEVDQFGVPQVPEPSETASVTTSSRIEDETASVTSSRQQHTVGSSSRMSSGKTNSVSGRVSGMLPSWPFGSKKKNMDTE